MAGLDSSLLRPSGMSDVFHLIMRRMRAPLIFLILCFAFCTAGLSLMPGVDDAGNPSDSMSLFDAFYVISYTATTIGFGEIPHAFSTAQRLWMTLSIYTTVVGWSFALVTIMAMVQDKSFQNALRTARFTRRIYHLREPFYIVCGAGETGSLVCRGLDRLGYRFVVIDLDDTRLQEVRLEDFRVDTPMIAADASQPSVLQEAGLLSPYCQGVMALVNDDDANQAIAVTTRLLAPEVPMLARIRNSEMETNVGVFGGDLVINPFDRFAEQLGAAVAAPQRYRLREILTGLEDDPMPQEYRPPKGHWIMCGYGRFGHAVATELRECGNTVTVVDESHFGEPGVDVRGTGADGESLKTAGIAHAVGIVAGNASDTKNLAVAVTARDLRPDIFVVTRQNKNANTPIYDAFLDDLAMVPSKIVAQEFLARITTPLLSRFLNRLPFHSEDQCAALCARLAQINQGRIPVVWSVKVSATDSEGIADYLEHGHTLNLGQLMSASVAGENPVAALVLLVHRAHRVIEQPGGDFELKLGDEILLAGSEEGRVALATRAGNVNVLEFVATGEQQPGGYIWQWWARRRAQRHSRRDTAAQTG